MTVITRVKMFEHEIDFFFSAYGITASKPPQLRAPAASVEPFLAHARESDHALGADLRGQINAELQFLHHERLVIRHTWSFLEAVPAAHQ